MKWYTSLIVALLWAQSSGYDPHEVIGEEPETPLHQKASRAEVAVHVNGEPFNWPDPLIIPSNQTYQIHIKGLKPHSKFIIRLFKAGQKAGYIHFDANEKGEIELEAILDKKPFKGTAEVVYYPPHGKEVVRRFMVKVQ